MSSNRKRALIFGIGGQDGSYLARLLVDRAYDVHGTSRTAGHGHNLHRLGVTDRVALHRTDVTDIGQVRDLINAVEPNEIYYLAGQSSVGKSFAQPVETFMGQVVGILNVLEALRSLKLPARVFNASSSEIFGDISEPATEENRLAPCTPYGVAKAASTLLVQTYRENYDLFACSGIMFNHESPLRPENFVSQHIIRGVIEIAEKRKRELVLIETAMVRDWGWAPDFVECMWRMLQQDRPEDYVIATGTGNSLAAFVERAFQYFDLDSKAFVIVNPDLMRPTDIALSVGDPAKAARQLGWKATIVMPQLVDALMEAVLKEENDETFGAVGRA
jgi:GDPmannose 4,6-dehydratase